MAVMLTTVSIDVLQGKTPISHEDVLHRADTYLYRAKEDGRNRVISGYLTS